MHLSCLGEPVFSRHYATSSTEIIDKYLKRIYIYICLFLLDNSFSVKTHRDLSQKVVIISQLYTTVFILKAQGNFIGLKFTHRFC